MSNVTVSTTDLNVNVAQTELAISVNESNNVITVTQPVSNISVTTDALANIVVSEQGILSNTQIRNSLSVVDTGYDLGSLTYSNTSGVFTFVGVNNSQIRGLFSNTSPITYNSSTGEIGLEQTLDDLTLKKWQETIVDNGNVSGAVTFNIANGTIHEAKLVGNVTNITLNNISAGGSATLILEQDEIGTWDIISDITDWSWSSDFKNLDTTANAYNVINVIYDGTKYYASLTEFNGNITETANITTSGNISGSYILGNGSQLTGIVADLSSSTTDDLAEGSSNLYYTDARSRSAVSVTQASASGAGTLAYNNTSGVFTYTPPDLTAFGLTNAQAQAYIQTNGLAMTNTITSDSNISTTANTSAVHGTFTGTQSITATGNVSIGGNLTVTGNIDSETVRDLLVEDRNITLGYGTTGAPSANSQIIIDRGSSANTYLKWDEGSDKWKFSNNGSTEFVLPTSTSDLSEGTNLYYTDARANSAISAYTGSMINLTGNIATTGNLQVNADTDVSGLSGLTFDSSTNNLGLGTTTPGAALHIRGTSNESQIFMTEYNGTSSAGVDLRTFRAGGTEASPTVTPKSDRIWESLHYAYDGVGTSGDGVSTGFQNAFSEQIITDPSIDHAANLVPVFKQFHTYLDGDATTTPHALMRMRSNGDIQFNMTNAFSYTGAANTVISKDGIITTNGNVTSVANINAGGGTLTGVLTSNSNITTTANINAAGGTLTGVLSSDSNIETTAFFEGDLNGAVTADVRNETGATLTKGKAVYLTGSATGDTPHVALADADDSAKMPALGIVYENIANASVGQVATSGVINVASHGFTQGADLFISTTAGDLTETAPTGESAGIQKIGKVVSANHILVQGAFRQNATPNLNENNIFIGNAANRSSTVALDGLSSSLSTSERLESNRLYGGNTTVDLNLILGSTQSGGGQSYIQFSSANDPDVPDGTKIFIQDSSATNPFANGSITSDNVFFTRKFSGGGGYYLLYTDEACQSLVSASTTDINPTTANVTYAMMQGRDAITLGPDSASRSSNVYLQKARIRYDVDIGETVLRNSKVDISGDATITNYSGNAALTLVNNINSTTVPTQLVMKQNKNAGTAAGVAGDSLSVIQTQGITANVTQSNTSVQDAQAYNNGTLTEDSISFSGGQIFADGTQVLYNSATDGDITPLNGLTFFLKYTTGDGGRYELFDDAGFTTGSRRITNGVFRTSGVGQVETSSTSAGSLAVFANVLTKITDPTLGSEDAEIDFRLMKAGTETSTLNLKSTEAILQVPLNVGTDISAGNLSINSADGSIEFTTESDVDHNFNVYRDGTNGVNLHMYKAGGNVSTANAIGANDYVFRQRAFAHDGTQFYNNSGAEYTVYQDANTGSVGTNDIPLAHEFAVQRTPNTGFASSVLKMTADRRIIFNDTGVKGFGSYTGTANISADGKLHTAGNITSDGNISGNYILGDGSQLQNLPTGGDSFGTVTVAGQTNIQATQANAVLDIASSGAITLTTSGNTLTIGGSGGSYGNSDVENFLTNEGVSDSLKINTDSNPAIDSIHGNDTATNGNTFNRQRSRGTVASPSAVQDGDTISKDRFYGYDGDSYEQAFQANVYVDGTVSNGDVPMGMKFAPFSGVANPPAAIDMRANSEIKFAGGNASISSAGVITANGSGLTGLTTSLISDFSSASNTAIAANLAALTSDISSSNLISTTGNLQVNADTTSAIGMKGLTFRSDFNLLGLGTTTPQTALDIVSDQNVYAQIYLREYADTFFGPDLSTYKARGSVASPTAVQAGDRLMELKPSGHQGTGFYNLLTQNFYVDSANAISTSYLPTGVSWEGYKDGDVTQSYGSLMKLRANGDFQIGNLGFAAANNAPNFSVTHGGTVSAVGNITTSANVSGNYILGNGSALTGLVTDTFDQIIVSGEANVDASGPTSLTLVPSGAITINTDAANNTVTIGGSGGSYGDSNVTTLLSGNTITTNIEIQGDIISDGDIKAANAMFTDALHSFTPGGTFTMNALRVTDFAANDPLGINIVANSALSGGVYANPFQGSIVYVTGDRHGSRGAPAYWSGNEWRYFSDDANVTI